MLALELDLAVTLSGMDDEARAMRIVVETLSPVLRACGVAVMADCPEGRIAEARGRCAADALEALRSWRRNALLASNATVVPFGDERGDWGGIATVTPAEEAAETDPASACSLERIGMLLSSTLRRIETSKRLDAALRDRDLLMREMRHRVRNSLQLVINLAPFMLGEAAGIDKRIQDDFEKRIAALISIHDLLSWTETKDRVSARTYFKLIADAMRRVTIGGVGTLVLDYDADEDPPLRVEQATTIGLIVHELVVNSTKHAGDRALRMDLRVSIEEGSLVLEYQDGRGPSSGASVAAESADPYAAAADKKGLGLELVGALLSRAGGERTDDGSTPHRFVARFTLD